MFQPSKSAQNGMVLTSDKKSGRRQNIAGPGGTQAGETDEPAEQIALADLDAGTDVDKRTRDRARQIAKRLALGRPMREPRPGRGIGDLSSMRWNGGSDDLDLDATLDRIAGLPYPEDDDFVVREWTRTPRSVVLVVDVSGSMKGERIRTAAATVGALSAELLRDEVSVVAFWSDAAVLVRPGELLEPLAVLDLLLRVPTQGLTNVSFALQTARRQLIGVPEQNARVLLLSDCVHNAGPDPRTVAAGLPRLDVLLDASGEKDVELGRELASIGRGQCRVISDYREVAPALAAIFGD